MKEIRKQKGSYKDFDRKVEQSIKIPAKTDTWEDIAKAIYEETEIEYTIEEIQAEYPNYLEIYEDGIVIMFL